MKIIKVESCRDCPLNTQNIKNSDELINIEHIGCISDPEHDVTYDINILGFKCVLTKNTRYEFWKEKSIPRDCPLENEK